MPTPEEHLRRAVDEVLEPAWPRERRRAVRRLAGSMLGRLFGGLLALWTLALLVHLVVGPPFPWAAFGLVTVLATAAVAVCDLEDRSHLRR
jgi:hypothetical protein